jgi:uncharacterized protein YjbI with pentapeptide repeats
MLDFLNDNKDSLDVLVKFFTLVFVASGFFWTVKSGLKTLRDNRKSKDEEQKVNWITFFNDKSPAKRLAGAYGLVKYTPDLFNEIFWLCIFEQNLFIKSLLYENLLNESLCLLNEFISINKFYTKILATYHSITANYKENDILSKKHLSFIYSEHKINRSHDESMRNFRFFAGSNCSFENMIDCIILSSHMIMHGFKKNSGHLIERQFFLSTDFLSNGFIDLTFKSCLFIDNSAVHTHFVNSKICDCYISLKNSFYGSTFKNSDIINTVIENSNFRKCSLSQVILSNVNSFANCDFSISDICYCNIRDSLLYQIAFRGCHFSHTNFMSLKEMKNCNFIGSKFVNSCEFRNVNVWSCNLSNCEIIDCSLDVVKFGGTDMSNTKFINVTFHNVDFSGVEMRNVTFINCKFIENPVPKNAKNIDTVKETNCQGSLFINSTFAPSQNGINKENQYLHVEL